MWLMKLWCWFAGHLDIEYEIEWLTSIVDPSKRYCIKYVHRCVRCERFREYDD
jgi:hypothetical protein